MATVYDEEGLKLIYVLKIGYNSKDEGMFEFIFSNDPTNINIKEWCWDLIPAYDNAIPPTEDYIGAVIGLKTSTFDLFCLHEDVTREYMHGVHTIHALAYETERTSDNGYTQFEKLMEDDEDQPLLVFHYGMTLARVKEIFSARKIILRNDNFVEVSSIKF
jgi:hypothetical protein